MRKYARTRTQRATFQLRVVGHPLRLESLNAQAEPGILVLQANSGVRLEVYKVRDE